MRILHPTDFSEASAKALAVARMLRDLLGGELILVLDKEEVTLHPGDAVIQRNTMHAWKNRTNAPVYWVAVLVPIRQRG